MPKTAQMFLAAGVTLLVNLVIWIVAFNLVGMPFERSLPVTLTNYLSVLLFGMGIGQLMYWLPVAIYLIWQRRWIWLQGLALGIVTTVILNGASWVLIAMGR